MSLGKRILRIGQRWVQDRLDDSFSLRTDGDPARRELEEFLRDPNPPRPRQAPGGGAGSSPPPPGSASRTPPPHPYAREYRLLGVPVGADFETVQRHWRALVRDNHPDHFADRPEEQARATERVRRINEAYRALRAYLETKGR